MPDKDARTHIHPTTWGSDASLASASELGPVFCGRVGGSYQVPLGYEDTARWKNSGQHLHAPLCEACLAAIPPLMLLAITEVG